MKQKKSSSRCCTYKQSRMQKHQFTHMQSKNKPLITKYTNKREMIIKAKEEWRLGSPDAPLFHQFTLYFSSTAFKTININWVKPPLCLGLSLVPRSFIYPRSWDEFSGFLQLPVCTTFSIQIWHLLTVNFTSLLSLWQLQISFYRPLCC